MPFATQAAAATTGIVGTDLLLPWTNLAFAGSVGPGLQNLPEFTAPAPPKA